MVAWFWCYCDLWTVLFLVVVGIVYSWELGLLFCGLCLVFDVFSGGFDWYLALVVLLSD